MSPTAKPTDPCVDRAADADLVFVVDTSFSINQPSVHGPGAEGNFDIFIQFLKGVFAKEEVVQRTDQVGIIEFARDNNIVVNPGDMIPKKIDLDQIKWGAMGETTHTHAAVDAALDMMIAIPPKARNDLRRITIITDGRPECPDTDIKTMCNPCDPKFRDDILRKKKEANTQFRIVAIENKDGVNLASEFLECLVDDPIKEIILIKNFQFFLDAQPLNEREIFCIFPDDEETDRCTHLKTKDECITNFDGVDESGCCWNKNGYQGNKCDSTKAISDRGFVDPKKEKFCAKEPEVVCEFLTAPTKNDLKALCGLIKHCKWKGGQCTGGAAVICSELTNKKACKKEKAKGCVFKKGECFNRKGAPEPTASPDECIDEDPEENCQEVKDSGICEMAGAVGKMFRKLCRKTCEQC